MKDLYMKNRQYIFGILFGVVIIFWSSSIVVDKKLDNLTTYLDSQISQQKASIVELASVTGRGGSNAQADLIVIQCSETDRENFEKLLSSLDKTLSNPELKTLDALFGGCGYVYANRRANMVSQLDREVRALENLSEQRALLGDYEDEKAVIKKWRELVNREIEIRDHFLSLVSLQKEIIDSLKLGLSVNSTELVNLRNKAQETKDELSVATEMASKTRNSLIES